MELQLHFHFFIYEANVDLGEGSAHAIERKHEQERPTNTCPWPLFGSSGEKLSYEHVSYEEYLVRDEQVGYWKYLGIF